MKLSKSESALAFAAFPGLMIPAYFVPVMFGFPPGALMMAAFITYILLLHSAGKAAEERKDEFYHRLSQQRQEMNEAQQTLAQVQAGEIMPPWSR